MTILIGCVEICFQSINYQHWLFQTCAWTNMDSYRHKLITTEKPKLDDNISVNARNLYKHT